MRIVPEHILAHRAVLKVHSILAEAGATSEIIKNDVGEDLFVQTTLSGSADSFHIMVQVKGRSKLKLVRNGYIIRLDREHILRWASFAQPVLVCVLDVSTGSVFAFSPRDRFSLWELHSAEKGKFSVRLSSVDEFTIDKALDFIWRCRISNYNVMLSQINLGIADCEMLKRHRYRKKLEMERNLLAFLFLKSLNIMSDDGFNDATLLRIKNGSNSSIFTKMDLDQVFHLVVLNAVYDCNKECGLPTLLLDVCSYVAKNYFRVSHSEDYISCVESLSRLEIKSCPT